MNKSILTKPAYWNAIQPATKSYWQKIANLYSFCTVCTHRPSMVEFGRPSGECELEVRRASTGGKHGKSSDKKWMNEELLLKAGYIFVTYTPAKVEMAAKQKELAARSEEIYSNDDH